MNLLNIIEALNSDKQSLADEVQRLKQKKKGKTTGKDDNLKPSQTRYASGYGNPTNVGEELQSVAHEIPQPTGFSRS